MKSTIFSLGMGILIQMSGFQAFAHQPMLENFQQKHILADLKDLKKLNIPILAKDDISQVGYAVITPKMQFDLMVNSHQVGKCGGFEVLPEPTGASIQGQIEDLKNLSKLVQKDRQYQNAPWRSFGSTANPTVANAIQQVQEANILATIQWLSGFPDRYNRSSNPNSHISGFKQKIESILSLTSIPYEIELVNHKNTPQQSIRVRFIGKNSPNEIVVMGGHLDSINQEWGGNRKAPGADDNASGSSTVLEAMRIIALHGQPQRTIEFYWYAGEESGLLGSAEIARQYKSLNKDVIAVLQLDMTMYPGSGELVIGNIADFTSSWLREYLVGINRTYQLGATLVHDECGYGCSDHASWYRQGYPTLMPFEATTQTMNREIHTSNDVIGPRSSMRHAAVFARIAVIFGLELANSQLRQPY